MENQQKQITEKEIKERQSKMQKFCEDNLPFLRIKAEHDMLQADIAEALIRRMRAESAFQNAMMEQDKFNKEAEKEKKDGNGDK